MCSVEGCLVARNIAFSEAGVDYRELLKAAEEEREEDLSRRLPFIDRKNYTTINNRDR